MQTNAGHPPSQDNWPLQLNMYHPVSEAMSHLILAMGASMLALKLSGETLSGNTDTALDGTTAGWWYIAGIMFTGHFLCAALNIVAYRHWRGSPTPQNPIVRFIRLRGMCEAVYSCLQHGGLLLVVARLPTYVAGAIRRAEVGGAGFGSMSGFNADGEPEPLGIHINAGSAVSINVIMGPLWAAWIAQECVSIYFDAGRSVVPDIENEELRHQLILVLKSIRIRSRVETFVFNVQLSFCARMLDNAYRVSWKALFIVAWISFAFMLCSLVYLGTAFILGYCGEGMQDATSIYRRLLCGSPRNVVMAMCAVAPVCCNFIFSLNLSRRLDGDESISELNILVPFIIGQFAAVTMISLSMKPSRETHAAALAGSALGLPLGPFSDMLDNTVLLSHQLQPAAAAPTGPDTARVSRVDILAAAVAAAEIRTRGRLEDERLRWEEQVRNYEAAVPTELLRQHADDSALYRARSEIGYSNATSQDGISHDSVVECGFGNDVAADFSVGESAAQRNDCFGVCQICFDDDADAIANTVLLPCGHGGVCRTCGMAVARKPSHLCHMCRGVVLKVVTVEPRGIDQETGLLLFEVASLYPRGTTTARELSAP